MAVYQRVHEFQGDDKSIDSGIYMRYLHIGMLEKSTWVASGSTIPGDIQRWTGPHNRDLVKVTCSIWWYIIYSNPIGDTNHYIHVYIYINILYTYTYMHTCIEYRDIKRCLCIYIYGLVISSPIAQCGAPARNCLCWFTLWTNKWGLWWLLRLWLDGVRHTNVCSP